MYNMQYLKISKTVVGRLCMGRLPFILSSIFLKTHYGFGMKLHHTVHQPTQSALRMLWNYGFLWDTIFFICMHAQLNLNNQLAMKCMPDIYILIYPVVYFINSEPSRQHRALFAACTYTLTIKHEGNQLKTYQLATGHTRQASVKPFCKKLLHVPPIVIVDCSYLQKALAIYSLVGPHEHPSS